MPKSRQCGEKKQVNIWREKKLSHTPRITRYLLFRETHVNLIGKLDDH